MSQGGYSTTSTSAATMPEPDAKYETSDPPGQGPRGVVYISI